MVEALGTVAAAIVAVIAIWVAVVDSKNRNSPMVVAEFRRAENNYFAINFVVKNYGLTLARRLKVDFDPKLKVDRADGTHGYLLPQRYSKVASVLAPGQELSNVWFYPKIVGNRVQGNRTTLPDNVTVTVTYKGNRIRKFREVFALDLDTVKHDSESNSSDSLPGHLKSIDQSLKDIAGHARTAARATSGIESALSTDEEPKD